MAKKTGAESKANVAEHIREHPESLVLPLIGLLLLIIITMLVIRQMRQGGYFDVHMSQEN